MHACELANASQCNSSNNLSLMPAFGIARQGRGGECMLHDPAQDQQGNNVVGRVLGFLKSCAVLPSTAGLQGNSRIQAKADQTPHCML